MSEQSDEVRLLAIDVGTTALKAAIFDLQGHLLAVSRQEYQLSTPGPALVELDPDIYWQACRTAVHAAVQASQTPPHAVKGLCIASQGETLIPLDAAGLPTRPAIVWLDNRAVAEAAEIASLFDRDAVYRTTGQPDVAPTWPACKILWMRRNEPDVFARTVRFLLAEDFLVERLTGECVTEWSLQSSSLLLDIHTRQWWEPMLDVVGIGPERLGRLIAPGTIVGHLTHAGAEWLGLTTAAVVVSGGLDQVVGAIGAGNLGPGYVTEVTGGALAIVATLERPSFDVHSNVPVHIHALPDNYCLLPWCQTAGMALQWFRDQFFMAEVEVAAREGRDIYRSMVDSAAGVPAGSDGLVALPHLEGATCPEFNPAARAVFFGATLRHTRGHFVRALMESVAYMLKKNLDLVERLGVARRDIRSIGGGARSDLWLQIKADVLQQPITAVDVEEVTCLGAALLAAVALGYFPTLADGAAEMVRLRPTIAPRPAYAPVYQAGYAQYNELYERLAPMFR